MRLIASSLMAGIIALGAVAPALADPPRGYNSRDWRDDRRDDRRDHRSDYRRDYRDDRRDDWRDDRRDHRRWHKGDRFDRRVHYVVVRDYHRYRDHRGYRLPPPRYGQYYARTNTGEILLIAAATGLVLWALND